MNEMEMISTFSQILPPDQVATMTFSMVFKVWFLSNFSSFLNWALLAIMVPIFTPIVAYFTLWVKSEFEQRVFVHCVNNVRTMVKLTVSESNQKHITKFPGGLNVPVEIKEKAFKEAFDKTLLYMSVMDKQIIQSRIPELDKFVTSLIESEVLSQAQQIDFSKVS